MAMDQGMNRYTQGPPFEPGVRAHTFLGGVGVSQVVPTLTSQASASARALKSVLLKSDNVKVPSAFEKRELERIDVQFEG